MAKLNQILSERFKQATEKLSKMTGLAELSSSGQLSSFSGVFQPSPLNVTEQQSIRELLTQHAQDGGDLEKDLASLTTLTVEIRAIGKQAAILHGARIKKAQEILKTYRDGAFSAWLTAAYGNRQTPYNFLQYYELYQTLPQHLHATLDEMPRQAVYSLSSRNGPLQKKEEIVRNYRGEPKQEILALIRKAFPILESDKRAQDLGAYTLKALQRLYAHVHTPRFRVNPEQRIEIKKILDALHTLLSDV